MDKKLYKITFKTQEGERHEVEVIAEDVAKAMELLARTHPAVYPLAMVREPHVRMH